MIHNLAAEETVFTSNTFLVEGERTVLVDAGANFDVVAKLESRGSTPDAVVVTHTHPDHVGNLGAVTEAFDVTVWGFDTDVDGVENELADGATVRMGDHAYTVLHTPGHKDDHVCLYADDPGILFAGDLVFANGGFGRTDLPEGDRATLVDSIDRVEAAISSSLTVLHAGHGPSITDDPYEHVVLAGRMARQ